MGEFDTVANVSLEIESGELRSVRQQIESELANISVGIDATTSQSQRQPRDPSTGQFMAIEGVEQRVIEQTELQVELLDEIRDALEAMGGGGGGGGGTSLGGVARGLGAGVGGGLGLTGLGIGAGVGIAGLGVGAGVGLATGNIQLPEEQLNINFGNIAVTPVLEGPFLESPEFTLQPQIASPTITLGDDAIDFNPVITPEMFNISPEVDIGANAFRFDPTFGPENFDFNPVIGEDVFQFGPDDFDLSPSFDLGDITIDPTITFNPTLNISPSLNITGIDLSGLSVDLRQEIINSRQFQNELDSRLSDVESDLETRIRRALE